MLLLAMAASSLSQKQMVWNGGNGRSSSSQKQSLGRRDSRGILERPAVVQLRFANLEERVALALGKSLIRQPANHDEVNDRFSCVLGVMRLKACSVTAAQCEQRVANLRTPPKCPANQIQIFDDKAQLVSKFLVTQVSCGAVHRKLLEPVSCCEFERPTGTRTP
jgi:hypothetical protein